MQRPRLSPLLLLALALGLGAGVLEVGLRLEPRLGLGLPAAAAWMGASAGLSVAWLLGAALVAWLVGRRSRGLVLAALLVVHLALWYRFEIVLNAFLYEVRVWGGLLGLGVLSLGLGLVFDRPLRRPAVAWGASALMALVGLALAAARVAPAAGPPREAGPNVVLVTLDTTRADRIGAYGSANATPVIDRLAREGALFEQAVATAPLTEASHLAILTGIPPFASGVVSNGTEIGERPALLPAVLRARGWATAGFVSGFPLHGRYGWTQGFEVYDDDFGRLPGLHRLSIVKAWDQVTLQAHALRERRGDRTTDRALAWLDRHGGEQFFLWLHLFDPHAPYEAPGHAFDPPTDGSPLDLPAFWPPRFRAVTSADWLTAAYEAEIRYADEQVGRLVAALEARGMLDDTIFVLTADHGESLTDHDYLFDHGDYLYDSSLLVPLVVRWAGEVPAGARLPCQVSNLDVTPTVLGLLGLDDGQARHGRDRSGDLRAGDCDEEAVISTTVAGRFVARPPLDHALRARGHKLIRHEPGEGRTDGVQAAEAWETCFNLLVDPAETAPEPRCLHGMSESLDQALAGGVAPVSPELDSETRMNLEALGYVE